MFPNSNVVSGIKAVSLKKAALFSGLVVALAATAFIRIPLPFTPVPLTLQTLVVLLAGGFLGARNGALAAITYIALGTVGFPVFAGQMGGLSGLAGPTGGYLAGFVVAAFFMGWALPKVQGRFIAQFALFAAGSLIILVLGAVHLSLFLNVGIKAAIMTGIVPFMALDLLKAFIAAGIFKGFNK